MQTIVYILPELFLSLTVMFLLMLGVFIKKSFKLVNLLTILSLIFAIALILNQPNEIVKVSEPVIPELLDPSPVNVISALDSCS